MKNIEIPKGFKLKNSKVVGDGNEKVIVSEIVKYEVAEDTLHLKVNDGNLHALCSSEVLLFVNKGGKMYVLDTVQGKEAYNKWAENGMKVCSESIEWRGENYSLSSTCCLMSTSKQTDIFDFEFARPCNRCKDDNIKRYKHNNTPILF